LRKLILSVGAAVAAGSAAAVLGIGAGHASPTNTTLNVVGEPYAKAVAILRAQGYSASFAGSVGSDVPQAQCIVASQKLLGTTGKMQLSLDCTAEAQPQQPAPSTSGSGPGTQGTEAARPTPGAPGIVTVAPTPVG
jgi:hypothetical protein